MKKSCRNCYYYSSSVWCINDNEFACMNGRTIDTATDFKLWRKSNAFRAIYIRLKYLINDCLIRVEIKRRARRRIK